MSIGKKMLLGGMALILLPLTVVGYYAYQISSGALARLGQERVSQVADLASGELGEAVQGKIDLVKEISMGNTMIKFAGILLEKGEDVSGPEYKAVEEKFKRFMASLGQDLQSLYVTGKKGRVLVDSRENKGRGTDLSGRKYFQEIMQGRDLALAAVFAKTTGKPVLVVGVPIKNAQGDLAGMMAAIVKLEAWSEKILKNKLGRTGYVFVLDEDGLVVIHPDPETIMKVNLGELDGTRALVGKMKKLEAGLDDYEYNGVSKIAGFSTIPVTGWKVVACQNSHEFWEFIREIRNGVILAGLLFSVLAVPLVVFFARRISKPLARAAKVADGVAAGDLTRRLDVNAKGEIGALAGSINAMAEALEQKSVLAEAIANGIFTRRVVLASDRDTLGQALLKMVGNLSDTISEVQQTVKQVAVGADQISESSQALSQGATEQAASLEEITSSLNEIGSQTTTNAENAAQANQLAETVRSAADTGNSRMAGVITAMGEINSASKEIAKIIKTIDDIAFQTNLLALNAAVEAARAGRHGKGFAVVAQEVRNLAGRSAKAAQETEELIEGTVRKVQTGSDIVGQTAEALEQIRGGVMKMADLTGEIAAASREQAAGIKQINQGLGQIDQVTQQNTANAEETASASQELSDQAERLRKTLEERFKVRKKRQRDDSKEDRAERVPAPKRIAAPETHRGRGDWTEERKTKASQGQALDPDAVISLDDDEFGRY